MLIALFALTAIAWPAEGSHNAALPVVGGVEEVILMPWGVRMHSRVDTGAAMSSLDARGIRVRTVRGQKAVRFVLVGDDGRRAALDLPLSGFRRVTTSDGGIEKRPMVEMDVCFAGHRVRAEFTLNDRSHMEYRVLIGRNILAGRFLVDVAARHIGDASCPAPR
jgi:hypothetical protein